MAMWCTQFHCEIAERVADEFKIIDSTNFGPLVSDRAEALFKQTELVIQQGRQSGLVLVLEILP